MIKNYKRPPDPPRWEWDFSGCKKDELRDCYFYEWMRELPIVRKKVDFWRKAHRGSKFDDWKYIFSSLTHPNRPPVFSYELFNFCPEWPEKPYLSIAAEERFRWRKLIYQPPLQKDKSRALERINFAFFIRDQIENKIEPSLDSLERGIIRKDGFHEIAAFEIDWQHPKPERFS
jgi:hypothetical protein